MVKVKDEPLIESPPGPGSKSPPHAINPMHHHPHHILKPCNNQNHHRVYHHYTYYHLSQSESEISAGGRDSAPKFYFGPGFEPQSNLTPATGSCAIHERPNGCCGAALKNAEYIVYFHVNPGVTISFQIGESTEILRGPVTVPMVSTNASPPIAMPVTVPAGHVVQQIVDESGTLRHVILSPQHPAGLVTLPPPHSQTYVTESNGSTGNQRHYQNIPHPTYAPQHLHTQIPPPSLSSGTPSPVQSQQSTTSRVGNTSPTPPTSSTGQTYCKDERTQRQHNKLKKKLQDKQVKNEPTNNGSYIGQTKLLATGGNNGFRKGSSSSKTGGNSVETSEDGEESSVQDEEDSVKIVTEILSSVDAPLVLDLTPRSALLQWAAPARLTDDDDGGGDACVDHLSESELEYEVLLSDKSKEMKFKSIYRGGSLSCRILDLKPGQEYSVCLRVHHGELQGSATDPLRFVTPPCQPDKPPAPKLSHKTKNTLQVRWNAANDNGSPIQHYILQCDDGSGKYVEIYKGKSKQHTMQKLRPATAYKLRVSATNEHGTGPRSDPVTFTTSVTPPAQPHPPTLVEATPTGLHLQWARRVRDDEFTLQLDDPRNAYGFMNVYSGADTHYLCNSLQYFTNYKFRLRAQNEAGHSPWSSEIQYATLPDRPSTPPKPTVKGRIQAYSFKLQWDPPAHSGGADIENYILELNSGSGYQTIYTGRETEATCDKLTPGTTYQLRVCCVGPGGVSNYSDPCTVTTDAIPPGQCSVPFLTQKAKPDSLSLSWSEPDYNGGAPVLEYEAVMIDPESNAENLVFKSKAMKFTIGELRPGCRYRFKVRAINRIGRGPWSEELVALTGAAAPSSPLAPSLTVKSSHIVLVEWKEPVCNGAAIKEYKLELNRTDSERNFERIYEGPETSHEVRNLLPATSYAFRVQASNSAGYGDFSEISSILTPAATPSAVVWSKHSATPTTITVNWNDVCDNGSPVIGYNIEIGDKLIAIEEPVTSHTIANLHSDTTYKLRIQAVNAIGEGPFSAALKISTLKFPPSPPKLQCLAIGFNFLKLKWGEGKNTDYSQYCVEMFNPRLKEFQCVYRGTAFTCKVNKLQELTSYKFRINASNDVGVGEYSQEYEFATCISPPSVLRAPKVAEIDDDGNCTLEWQAAKNPFSDSLLYEVQLSRNNEAFYKVYKDTDTTCRLSGLEEDVKYAAKVCPIRMAASGELEGPFSPIVSFKIPPNKTQVETKLATSVTQIPAQQIRNRNFLQKLRSKMNFRTMSERQCVFAYTLLFMVVGILIAVMSITLYDYK